MVRRSSKFGFHKEWRSAGTCKANADNFGLLVCRRRALFGGRDGTNLLMPQN